jgi:septal ring factor EnvC (AmiA/AmiB activator)
MPSLEERMQALERKHTELEKTIELQTIAIGALVNKATLERLNERYDKLFETLINHDQLTNNRLVDLQNQLIELDGKIVGQQTEMRQRFTEQDNKTAKMQTTLTEHTTLLQKILARLPEKP